MNIKLKVVKKKLQKDVEKLEEDEKHGAFNGLWISAHNEIIEFINTEPTTKEFIKFCNRKNRETGEMAIHGVFLKALKYLKEETKEGKK